nr:MAG TPA: hypothetical protein [Caudoviricetes sp.]
MPRCLASSRILVIVSKTVTSNLYKTQKANKCLQKA